MHFENHFQQEGEKVSKLKDELKHFKFRNRALTDTVDRMAGEITDLRQRLENLEVSSARRAVTLSGYRMRPNRKKYEQIQDVEHFLQRNIGVTAIIDELYIVGSNQLIIIYFQSIYDKRQVMRYKHYLKDIQNEEKKSIFINDYTPTVGQERKRIEKEIVKENLKKEEPDEVKYTKAGLSIRGETFRQKVTVPTPKQIIDHTSEELDAILKTPLEKAGVIKQEGSSFTAYVASVDNFKDIRKLYIKMKLVEPGAKHISCSYIVDDQDTPEQPYYTRSYCDDGEPNAGKYVLDFMIKNNIRKRVIFIARHYGGIRMGTERFECYVQAAKTAIQQYPHNSILNHDQNISVPSVDLPGKRQPKPPPKEQAAEKRPLSSPTDGNPPKKTGERGTGKPPGSPRSNVQVDPLEVHETVGGPRETLLPETRVVHLIPIKMSHDTEAHMRNGEAASTTLTSTIQGRTGLNRTQEPSATVTAVDTMTIIRSDVD